LRTTIRIGVLLATTTASVAAVFAAGQPAFADAPGPIVNLNSGMCLQPVPNAFETITDNGVRIAQMPCTPGLSEQNWQPTQVGTSGGQPTYYLINQRSGKCLDVTDANTSDRAPIQQFGCNGGGSEKWFARAYNFGRFQYANTRTAKCLDIPGATTSAAYIWQYRCTTSNAAQAFTFPS
jgi:hypothetical protein